jgi:hypothetical protein
MAVFHWSTKGFSGYFVHDASGMVATTAAEVMRLDWGKTPTAAEAREIASENRKGLRDLGKAGRNYASGRGFRA